ncbi:MAG: hypothetical protein Q9195_009315 [Heterodermia aff. obscurata]
MGLSVAGTGGVDRVGDNENLRLILYAPRSKFDNDTLDAYNAGLPLSILEEKDITMRESLKGPLASRKRTGSDLSILLSQGPKSPKTRCLGGGWVLAFDNVVAVVDSIRPAAADLEAMYSMVVQIAAGQIGKAENSTESIAFHYGSYRLQLSSANPISWTWVVNFAEEMLGSVRNHYAVLFKGEAYSYYWEIAAVAAALTIV